MISPLLTALLGAAEVASVRFKKELSCDSIPSIFILTITKYLKINLMIDVSIIISSSDQGVDFPLDLLNNLA